MTPSDMKSLWSAVLSFLYRSTPWQYSHELPGSTVASLASIPDRSYSRSRAHASATEVKMDSSIVAGAANAATGVLLAAGPPRAPDSVRRIMSPAQAAPDGSACSLRRWLASVLMRPADS